MQEIKGRIDRVFPKLHATKEKREEYVAQLNGLKKALAENVDQVFVNAE